MAHTSHPRFALKRVVIIFIRFQQFTLRLHSLHNLVVYTCI